MFIAVIGIYIEQLFGMKIYIITIVQFCIYIQ